MECKDLDLSQPEIRNSYQRLLNHLPGAVYRCEILESERDFSREYTIRLKFISRGISRILGMDSQDLKLNVNTLESLTLPEDLVETKQVIYQSWKDRTPYQLVYRMKTVNGELRWVWDQGEVVMDGVSGSLFIEGLMMDLSEFKNCEEALREENRQLRSSMDTAYGMGGIVGKSPAMQTLYEHIRRAGESRANVLIRGETGSGKELVARAIHDLSAVCRGPFIPVNCGAIPEQLLESEFFGYRKGAFSGAVSNRMGFVGAAHNGTLFLDEIGELPLHLQVKLLRVLETKTYTPLGSNQAQRSSFRLIAATNQNLQQMIRERTMRSDLFYRINVIPIHVPPLRDRSGDIPLLLSHYMTKNGISMNIPVKVRIAMEQYAWPGNVRELINFMDRYFMFGESAIDDLNREDFYSPFVEDDENCTDLETAMQEYERSLIVRAMDKVHWKQAQAAEMLNVSLRTFQRKLQKLGIHR